MIELRPKEIIESIDSGERYQIVSRIGKGAYASVWLAKKLSESSTLYALKTVNIFGSTEGFPMDALREIKALRELRHNNVINLEDVVVTEGRDGKRWYERDSGAQMFLVMEYCKHDMAGLIYDKQNVTFHESQIKAYIYQLLQAVSFIHESKIIHRDIKTANILVSNDGLVKLADFGLSKKENPQIRGRKNHNVQTLWYRAPELLLGDQHYTSAIDMWSVGCVLAEFIGRRPLFFGRDEKHQLEQIFYLRGTPHEGKFPQCSKLPKWSEMAPQEFQDDKLRSPRWYQHLAGNTVVDLLSSLLELDPKKRITAREALDHEWFKCHPLAELLPTSNGIGQSFTLPDEPRNIMYIKKKEAERKNLLVLNKSLGEKRKREDPATFQKMKERKCVKQQQIQNHTVFSNTRKVICH